GATRGLGRCLVPQLAGAGHTVLGCGRSASHLADLRSRFSAAHDFAAVDVSDDASVEVWAKRLLAQYGPPELVINKAGLMNDPAPLWQIPAEEFDRLIDVNIKGVANVIRHFVPAMVERRTGVIVNLSSGWGRSTSPGVAPYCCSKWAIEGLTRALAQELPAGIAAIPLNPGIIDTDMLRQCWADEAAGYETADEWAKRAAPFLLRLGPSDNGKPMTVS